VAAIHADPRVFWWLPEPLDHEGARLWLEGEMHEVRAVGTGLYAVVLTATGQVIGGVSLKRRAIDDDHEVELGYHLGSEWWGRGYATEAARAMLAEARARDLTRIIALIRPDNPRSREVAVRLEMSLMRRLDWDGTPHDFWALTL
jgi:RimJ/RimL family protein N-acetyltransferase